MTVTISQRRDRLRQRLGVAAEDVSVEQRAKIKAMNYGLAYENGSSPRSWPRYWCRSWSTCVI